MKVTTTNNSILKWAEFNSSPPSAAYMHASVIWVSIGSDNGLAPIWCQAII